MKTLLVMRHAKSSWKEPGMADHDRPLNDRGKQAAPKMGTLISEQGLCPDVVICSSAKRARKTAERVTREWENPPEISVESTLYLAAPGEYVSVLRVLPDDVERAMVIGHNPGLESLVAAMTGVYTSMPTAAIAHIRLPIDHWMDLDLNGEGDLAHFWQPRDL